MSATGLSDRQKQIAALLMEGKRSKAIAFELNISLNTVRTHIQRMRDKAGLTGRSLARLVLHYNAKLDEM